MPQEIKVHSDVLKAVSSLGSIADIAASHDGHYDYEIDLEVMVYGRNYNGKKVGPYVRLFEYKPGEDIIRAGEWGGNSFFFITGGKADVLAPGAGGISKVAELPAGAQFGEMSVLAGVPRAATVRAPPDASVRVLEVQRPALRLLRKLSKFGEALDNTYRRNGRSSALQALAGAGRISPDILKKIEEISQFRVFTKNHILFRRGGPVSRIYIVKSGWLRLENQTQVSNIAGAEAARDWKAASDEHFFGPGHCFGVEAITRESKWAETGTLMGRTEVLEISLSQLRERPELREALLASLGPIAVTAEKKTTKQPLPIVTAQEKLIETGLVDGTNLLVMDMDMCVRCGNCSLACHTMHGQSRLLRRGVHIERPVQPKIGASFQSVMSPSVCMHCQDPECLTGCPTGAIGRFSAGEVGINAKTCIGCGDCATQCPYNAISMVPRRPAKAENMPTALQKFLRLDLEPLPAEVTETSDLVAVKCNLCGDTPLNPPEALAKGAPRAFSCEQNCPTGALLRVNPREYFSEIKQIEGLTFRDSTHAIGRGLHTSHQDKGKQLTHLAGMALTIALTALTVLIMFRTGRHEPLAGAWLNFYWLSGLVGLLGILVVMAYPVRRQMYKKRAGPLRYWMLVHSYAGVIAGLVLLLHGGTHSGGALTTTLMITFDLVILTGLYGIFCYQIAPRLLTKIEGQPLLVEDLQARREELSEELGAALASASQGAREVISGKILPRFFSFGYLLRQYLKKESLDDLLVAARTECKSEVEATPAADRRFAQGAVEAAATLRRVDALIYLHQMLKLWLGPHVVLTALMLALLVAHIIQVIWFASF
ncbi:MAG: cyclic nucleotide-binding domain-containing protein [Blastocatellia bacterium]